MDAQALPHEQIISKLDEAGKTFHILVLKSTMTIPYTSVFIRLDCGYWTEEQEKRLRERMGTEVRVGAGLFMLHAQLGQPCGGVGI